jgi:hypothetical protein
MHMPSISREKMQFEKPVPGVETSEIQWGGMTVGFMSVQEPAVGMDMAPLFKGLPGDRCQAPHWGYVLKGSIKIEYSDREETFTAGQAYYMALGHIPHIDEPSEFVEFTREEEMRKTMEVMQRNLEALQAAQATRR